MKFLVSCLLALLVPCSVMAGLVIPVSPSKFTDPYSNNDALLDMFLPTSCANGLTVRVNLPSVDGGPEANARFQGPAFSKTVNGISIATGSSVAVSALLTWDPVANTLTFQDFSTGSWAPWNSNPGYINVNFDIPSAEFQNPGAPDYLTYPGTGYATYTDTDPTHVPLVIVGLNPPESAPLFIDLHNVATDFTVGQSSDVRCGPSGPHGDPVFSGFQGQEFQFHGLPDEHFNVVSSPDLQLNSHFVYLSAGKCDYNDTECWTHPGTYMDVLGFQIAEAHIKIVAGTHDQGLRVWFNDVELPRGAYIKQVSTNITTASLKYHKNGKVQIITDIMGFEVVNSDMFMNIRTVLNNQRLLHIGATKHTVTDAQICKTNGETHNYQLVEATVAAKYPVTTSLHGLMGQTWRNVKVCGRDWMGTVADYLVSDLFANDNHYNYFKW